MPQASILGSSFGTRPLLVAKTTYCLAIYHICRRVRDAGKFLLPGATFD